MGDMFSDADLATMNLVRCTFDPDVRMNPGKVFPTPRLCGDRPASTSLTPANSPASPAAAERGSAVLACAIGG